MSGILERELTIIEVWDTDFEVEERPSPEHRLFCLYCLARCGRVRFIHWRSRSFMCNEHDYLYQSWREARQLSPIAPLVIEAGVGRSRHGEQVRCRIVEMLAAGEMVTMDIARALGRSREGALYQLHRLVEMGQVVSRWDGAFYWRLA